MALHLISLEEIRKSCRQRIEACELWLRRLVHDALYSEFGNDYIHSSELNGNAIFKSEIKSHVDSRIAASPNRYARKIDTLQLDHLASVICKQDVYKKYFKQSFSYGFPTGSNHLNLILNRLVPIRNALSHANPITIHDAERALCYCNDIISSLIEHYSEIGMEKDFNAPSFTRFSDSIGNTAFPDASQSHLNFNNKLRSGETIRVEVEVDSHFLPEEYTIQWVVNNISNGETGSGDAFVILLTPRHVGEKFTISAILKSKEQWHKHGNFDARLAISYTVLPPVS